MLDLTLTARVTEKEAQAKSAKSSPWVSQEPSQWYTVNHYELGLRNEKICETARINGGWVLQGSIIFLGEIILKRLMQCLRLSELAGDKAARQGLLI